MSYTSTANTINGTITRVDGSHGIPVPSRNGELADDRKRRTDILRHWPFGGHPVLNLGSGRRRARADLCERMDQARGSYDHPVLTIVEQYQGGCSGRNGRNELRGPVSDRHGGVECLDHDGDRSDPYLWQPDCQHPIHRRGESRWPRRQYGEFKRCRIVQAATDGASRIDRAERRGPLNRDHRHTHSGSGSQRSPVLPSTSTATSSQGTTSWSAWASTPAPSTAGYDHRAHREHDLQYRGPGPDGRISGGSTFPVHLPQPGRQPQRWLRQVPPANYS